MAIAGHGQAVYRLASKPRFARNACYGTGPGWIGEIETRPETVASPGSLHFCLTRSKICRSGT